MEIIDRNIELAGLRFDPTSGSLTGEGGNSKLEPRAAEVLTLLASERGALVSRQRILDSCWGEGGGSDEALTQAIAQIRRALESLGAPRDLLTTYPKRGYRLASGSSPAQTKDTKRHRTSSWLLLAALTVVVAALMLIVSVAPGWPRHAIRHALGLGPVHWH